jgi:hypothetical protein
MYRVIDIDIENIRMICKYDSGHSLSATECEIWFHGINCEHHEKFCSHKRICERNGNEEVEDNNREM